MADAGRGAWAGLSLILLSQLLFSVLCVAPKHILYVDEFWYLEAAKNIMVHGYAGGFGKAVGWPILISIAFLFFKIGNLTAIYLCTALGVAASAAFFLVAFALTRRTGCALLAGVMSGFLPARLVWAASAETAIPALFFVLLAVFLWVRYYETDDRATLWAGMLSWSMAAQIRPEMAILLALFAVGVLLWRSADKKSAWWAGLSSAAAASALLVPNAVIYIRFQSSQNWAAVDSRGLIKGGNFSLANLVLNSLKWLPKIFGGGFHPWIFSVLAAAGFLYLARRRWRLAAFLAVWCGLLYVFYFSAWFDFYGGALDFPKTKLLLQLYPVWIITASAALCAPFWEGARPALRAGALVLAGLLAWRWPSVFAAYAIGGKGGDLETHMLAELERYVPKGYVLVAASPTVARATNFLPVVEASTFLRSEALQRRVFAEARGVAFLDDLTCHLGLPEITQDCLAIRRDFNAAPMVEFNQGRTRYTLYRIMRLGGGGRPDNRIITE
jgi:hypothetical protein